MKIIKIIFLKVGREAAGGSSPSGPTLLITDGAARGRYRSTWHVPPTAAIKKQPKESHSLLKILIKNPG